MNKQVYMAGGYNTISLGTGRKEFNPKKSRPGLEHYISEAGKGTLAQVGGAKNIDESVIGNFMAARFNNQGHLSGFTPMIDKGLKFKPTLRVEAACASVSNPWSVRSGRPPPWLLLVSGTGSSCEVGDRRYRSSAPVPVVVSVASNTSPDLPPHC